MGWCIGVGYWSSICTAHLIPYGYSRFLSRQRFVIQRLSFSILPRSPQKPCSMCNDPYAIHASLRPLISHSIVGPFGKSPIRIISFPQFLSSRLELDHSISCKHYSPHCTNQPYLFVLSLYKTRWPHSLHRIGSPLFKGTFELQSPHR